MFFFFPLPSSEGGGGGGGGSRAVGPSPPLRAPLRAGRGIPSAGAASEPSSRSAVAVVGGGAVRGSGRAIAERGPPLPSGGAAGAAGARRGSSMTDRRRLPFCRRCRRAGGGSWRRDAAAGRAEGKARPAPLPHPFPSGFTFLQRFFFPFGECRGGGQGMRFA